MFAHPTPQSRDRMYFVAWKRGNRKPDLKITPRAFCPHCNQDQDAVQSWKQPARPWGKYGRQGQYLYRCTACAREVTPYYYAAVNAIDWSLPAQKIGERKKPLKPKTIQRIARGLQQQSQPVEPSTVPFLVNLRQGGGGGGGFAVQARPFPTQRARDDVGLAVPFVLEQLWEYRARPVTDPLTTVVAEGNHHGLVLPPAWLLSYYQNGTLASVAEPVSTVTTLQRHALVTSGQANDVSACGF